MLGILWPAVQCVNKVKVTPAKALGLLHPLEILTAIWVELSLNFITGLPLVKGHVVIIIVVDWLSKYCHIESLLASYSTSTVTDYFLKNIIRLHGIPKKMVSDRDKIFLSKFWQEIFAKSGTTLTISMAYHPESDRQTEIVNKTIEVYL